MLSVCCCEALNGAFGVLVGLGVFVGGTNENGVFDGIGVKVGREVFVGDTNKVGLGVHVASICSGVGVSVGTCGPKAPGRSGLSAEFGLKKINPK